MMRRITSIESIFDHYGYRCINKCTQIIQEEIQKQILINYTHTHARTHTYVHIHIRTNFNRSYRTVMYRPRHRASWQNTISRIPMLVRSFRSVSIAFSVPYYNHYNSIHRIYNSTRRFFLEPYQPNEIKPSQCTSHRYHPYQHK